MPSLYNYTETKNKLTEASLTRSYRSGLLLHRDVSSFLSCVSLLPAKNSQSAISNPLIRFRDSLVRLWVILFLSPREKRE